MAELRTALARFDDVLRQVDGVLGEARSVADRADTSPFGIPGATDELVGALGPAMPDQLGTNLQAHRTTGRATIDELILLRADLGRLGAVSRGVLELGGVDAVARQGGLDAIDGAAKVVQRHLFEDGRRQLDGALAIVDDAPSGLIVTSGARADHLRRIQARIAAPALTIRNAGGVPQTYSTPDLAWRLRSKVDREVHASALQEVRSWINSANGSNLDALSANGSDFHVANLVSERARHIGAQQLYAHIPHVDPLSKLADDVVLDHAIPALDRHVLTLETVTGRVGDAAYYKDEYKLAVTAAQQQIRQAIDDAAVLERVLADGPDRGRNAAWLVRDWGTYLLEHSGSFNARDNGAKMLPTTLEQLRVLREQVGRVVDDPQLLHASSDASEELRSILERPGTLDVAAIRQLLDGDAPQAVHRALAEHVANLKPIATDAPPAGTVEEARRLLDEADLISEAVRTTAGKHLGREAIKLNDPSVLAATEQALARHEAALGVADRVPEQLGNAVRGSIGEVRKKLPTFEAQYDMYLPQVRDLERLDTNAAAYRAELLKVTERATADGGLRAIPPSARPAQAQQAQASWLMRELDSLPAIAADAPPEAYVDTTARRLSLVADLLQASGANRYSSGTADGNVLTRAASEVSSVDDLWRYPDDTALTIAGARRTFESGNEAAAAAATEYTESKNLVTSLRRAAGELRAWSALPDGTLPNTSLDRISVAARRGDAMRMSADNTGRVLGKEHPVDELTGWVADVDTRLADLDVVLGGAMPRAERTAVDDALAAIRANLDHRAELTKSYSGSKWVLDRDALEAARLRVGELDAAIARVHLDARSTDAERLAW